MPSGRDTRAGTVPPPRNGLRLEAAAAELYDDLRLDAILGRLLAHSGRLLDVGAGSISLVEASGSRYAKVAERGASCQVGRTFPLDEGLTGQVAARRRPVVVPRYSDVRAGHLPAAHPAAHGAAVAVPIWWRGDVVGANVAFAGRSRAFTAAEVDQLEVLSQVGAAGIVTAGGAETSLAARIRDALRDTEDGGPLPLVTEAGTARPTSPLVAETVVELVGRARPCASDAGTETGSLRVAVLYRPDGLRLLVHTGTGTPAGAPPVPWHDLVAPVGGGVQVESVPGWGVLVRADLPYDTGPQQADDPSGPVTGSPDEPALTRREREVLALLARGLSDRQVAQTLVLSRKTVEKHVSAVLRKTGTTSRTAAVVRSLERGWVPRRSDTGG